MIRALACVSLHASARVLRRGHRGAAALPADPDFGAHWRRLAIVTPIARPMHSSRARRDHTTSAAMESSENHDRRTDERRSFLFLTVVMVPALTVMIVVGYGFLVWMYQLVAGPPSA